MTSLIVHAVIGIALIVWIVRSNQQIFARPVVGQRFSRLEIIYWLVGIAAIPFCYYFNYLFVLEYKTGVDNPIWGPGSWTQFIELGYANPAASSASLDYTIISLILWPLFAIIDGKRRGIRRAWMYFAVILFTSTATGIALYFATVERQHRLQKADAFV
jgi:hypothetical protein